MQCQQEAARPVTQQRVAYYLFELKDNQEGILQRANLKLPGSFFPKHDAGGRK